MLSGYLKIMQALKIDLSKKEEQIVICGLGNIGKDYEMTRHNAGFLFVEVLKEVLESKGHDCREVREKEYLAYVFPELKLTIIKPLTLMNRSGQALTKWYRYHDPLKSRNLIVVHDDLDLLLGDFKVSTGKGPKLHNGLRSLEQELGTGEFPRIRIGIENRQGVPIPGLDYVLHRFNDSEVGTLVETFKKVIAERFII